MSAEWDDNSFGEKETLRTVHGAGSGMKEAEEAESFGDRETLRDAVAEEDASFGDRETLRDEEEGWGILEEWGGKRWKAGEEILGRYVVERELGQGGMGVVYACVDKVGGVRVAVKALPPELSHNSVEMEEVRANFELVYGLSHPNIAGVRTLEKDGRGEYFLVMEVAEGEPLRRWMRRKSGRNGHLEVPGPGGGGREPGGGGNGQKPGHKGKARDAKTEGRGPVADGRGIPLVEVLPVLRQVAAALDYAHWKKVVHRDVKPGNVVIDARGDVKVLDFGLAAQIRTSLSRASQAYRGTSGTGPYMAPEQWRGQPQDGAADQYALGVMAYEMLAGRLPFENSEMAVLREVVLKEKIPDIPGLPKGAMGALRRAMAKREEDRWASCEAFVEALGGGRPKGGGRRRRRRGGWSAALAALLVAGAGIGTWAWLDHGGGGKRVPVRALSVVASEESKQMADEARADAEEAKAAAEGTAGGKEQAGYKRAAALVAAAEVAYETMDYSGAAAQWVAAAEMYASAKESAARDVRERAESARRDAEDAKGRASGVAGVDRQAGHREAEEAMASASESFRRGHYEEAGESWKRAAEKYRAAAAAAKQSLVAAAKAAAKTALDEVKRTKGEAAKVAGAGTQASYGEAEAAFTEGKDSLLRGDYEGAKSAWERAAGKYKAAVAAAEVENRKAAQLAAVLKAARDAAEKEWWEEVQRKAEEAQEMAPGHLEAKRLSKAAEEAMIALSAPKEAESARPAGTVEWVWLPGGEELEMVWCPPGAPGSGGEALPGFWLGRTEVTQGQWQSLMGSSVLKNKGRGVAFPPEADLPMRAVSWAECVEYCEMLNEKAKMKPGMTGVWRLPREAEWKWASQAGGDGAGTAWFQDSSKGHPHAVREGLPNAWKLFDMRGNVEEWCADRWGEEGISRELRVIRGGAYNSVGEVRRWGREGTPEPTVGFRVCLEE